jgi:hypothetical protein
MALPLSAFFSMATVWEEEHRTELEEFPPSFLAEGDLLAVETNITI